MFLCENGCHFKNYSEKTVECDCITKINLTLISDIKINKEELKKSFNSLSNGLNLNILKCYKILFTQEGLITNIGSYVLLPIIFIHMVNYKIFYLLEKAKLFDKIKEIYKNLKKKEWWK